MHQRNAQPRVDHAETATAIERRSASRVPVPEVIVAVELPEPTPTASGDRNEDPGGFGWAGSAIDVSGDGLALALPVDIPEGTELLLTFMLDDETSFSQVPAKVVRTQPGFGLTAVRFRDWTLTDRRALQSYLASR
jgi:hypothetical protein